MVSSVVEGTQSGRRARGFINAEIAAIAETSSCWGPAVGGCSARSARRIERRGITNISRNRGFVMLAVLDCDGPATGRAAPASESPRSRRSRRSLRLSFSVSECVNLVSTHEQLQPHEPGENRAGKRNSMTGVGCEQHKHRCDRTVCACLSILRPIV